MLYKKLLPVICIAAFVAIFFLGFRQPPWPAMLCRDLRLPSGARQARGFFLTPSGEPPLRSPPKGIGDSVIYQRAGG